MVRRLTTVAFLAAVSLTASCGLPLPPPAASPPSAPNRVDLPAGQSPQVFRDPKASGGETEYLLYLPEGYKSAAEPFPLVVYLHGRSLRGDDVELVARYGLPRRLETERVFPFVVISPQIGADERWTDVEALAALVDDAIARLPVDPQRVYLTGFSMGGGGVWRFANAYPDLFAAAVPLAASREDGPILGLAKVPVWAFHGSDDEATPASDSESMVSRIREAGGTAKLTVLAGKGHDILEVYDDDEIFTWLLQHRKLAATGTEPGTANENERVPPRERKRAPAPRLQ